VCQRLMTVPAVGRGVSLAFDNTMDIPEPFKDARAVGPVLGLTQFCINPVRVYRSAESRSVEVA
jgi:hypothetical protein